ncbi:hypothetical protein ACHAXA_003164 [Cyclostephanos tholiformis]|uniref:Protein kinase domain-containing protein n=1 Tax=Cyclostephanos tholiformis TaxID=382380 RepID=A0ABD3SSN7_9STRA
MSREEGILRRSSTESSSGYDVLENGDVVEYAKRRGGEETISIPLPIKRMVEDATFDLAGSTVREFGLGTDVMLIDYAGSAGYDRVTDWQYYEVDIMDGYDGGDGDEGRRTPVNPRPLDPNQPSRTRERGGGVVRLFRGELIGGTLGSKIRSRGLDARVWIKEYSGDDALSLAKAEKMGLGRLQSAWLRKVANDRKDMLRRMEDGEWMEMARRRYVDGLTNTPTRADDENLITLLELLSSRGAQFASLLGELNLDDYYDDEMADPNGWYKSLGVRPPKPGSVWLIFDYHGTFTASSYAVPSAIRRSRIPPKRGIFGWGIVEPPPLPPFRERANYVVRGVLRGMMSALATAHDAGLVHRSIGRSSFVLSSVGQDKREATSPYAVVTSRLRVILSDWGFSSLAMDAAREKEFGVRSRIFGIPGVDSYGDRDPSNDRAAIAVTEFAKAEDLHALGFVFLAMLFTTLAEPATLTAPMPATDDDTWQRLFSDIFEKDMVQFREYCANEEVWDSVVELLDEEDGAGWDLLRSLLLSRERLRDWYKDEDSGVEIVSASGLLSHPFFRLKMSN